jgi:hypothetical protein
MPSSSRWSLPFTVPNQSFEEIKRVLKTCVYVRGSWVIFRLSAARTVESKGRVRDDLWIGKDFERSGRGLIEILHKYLTGGIEENHENPVRISGVPAEIRTKHLPNMRLNRTATPNISVYTPLCPCLLARVVRLPWTPHFAAKHRPMLIVALNLMTSVSSVKQRLSCSRTVSS